MLSRVTWPPFPIESVLLKLEHATQNGKIRRVCIQTLNYPSVFKELLELAKCIHSRVKAPISVSCQPLTREKMKKLVKVGVERIGIPLDAATKELFEKIKGKLSQGPYVWETQRQALLDAVQIFGKGFVSTHLIVGLGEKEREMVEIIQWCTERGIYPALFAFTPIPGTPMENCSQPELSHYRRVQVARFLIVQGKVRFEKMTFDEEGCLVDFGVSKTLLREVVQSGKPFLTSGCPHCNRPYYNESPSGPIYNYPRPLTAVEIHEVKKQLFNWK